jgi:hypothetical protein
MSSGSDVDRELARLKGQLAPAPETRAIEGPAGQQGAKS